ncbi:class I SAM-dependent methyltransferase [Dactylosporangium sp. McL0621]|uniref:class I SAM-dependent methyltransferase n=1 Tax=Dactylosporangium sp. McL0621 TaxID=3415678 RepID=UPI003CEE7830
MTEQETVEALILAVGGRPDDVRAAVDRLGAGPVAEAVVAELRFRAAPPADLPEVNVQLDLVHGERTLGFVVTLSGKGATADAGQDPDAPMWVSYELADLVRAVYGPSGGRAGHTRRVELRLGRDESGPPNPKAYLVKLEPVSRAVHALFGAVDPAEPDLGDLAVRYATDKWGGLHWFTPHYQRHFSELRDEPVRLLEIGIGGYEQPHLGGGSLRTWKRYFRRGLIYGLDIFDKSAHDEPRITTLRGDQSDPAYLREMAERYGPFDIIVDDGSHISGHVLVSLRTLLPYVRPGGYYVVEDLMFSYFQGFGGSPTDLNSPDTSVGFLKTLADGLHYEDRPGLDPAQARYFDRNIGAVHFYRGVAVIEKSANAEGSLPPWIPRSGMPPRPAQ